MEQVYPPPWHLYGDGYIFLYNYSNDFIREECFCPEYLADNVFKGLGCVMLVNYLQSNAGPYRELLFMPGKFNYNEQKLYSITKIYVSTVESVKNGRKNWGIPKELADFTSVQLDSHRERVVVHKDGELVIDVVLKTRSFPFPVRTRYYPFPLIQKYGTTTFFTEFNGRGRGRFAVIEEIQVNNDFFPDIASVKPLTVVHVENFSIEFPVPRIIKKEKGNEAG
jgi:hypothetical protein